MRRCFDLVTVNPATIMHLDGYGLDKGCVASLVVLEAGDCVEALRLRANRTTVIAKGKVVARTGPRRAELELPGRPKTVDRRHAIRKEGQS